MSVTIVEILGRAEQGATLPFLCRGDDDSLYYVKGYGAGLRSMCCEWVSGQLALEMGLPVPRFEIVEVPEALIAGSDRADIWELGAGPVFASARVEGATEINWTEAEEIPVGTMAKVLHFDWWVHNEDRSLSKLGGNPNLLMGPGDHGARRLWVFDFNLAFDPEFSPSRFWENHLFAGLLPEWPMVFREEVEPSMHSALHKLPGILESLPLEWLGLDLVKNEAAQFNRELVFETLSRAFTLPDTFWSRP